LPCSSWTCQPPLSAASGMRLLYTVTVKSGLPPSSEAAHQPVRVAGAFPTTRLATTTHAKPATGQITAEYKPSGAQNPPDSHVVPPSTPMSTTPTATAKRPFEISPARQNPNDPAMISIARGQDDSTTTAQARSFSADTMPPFADAASEYALAAVSPVSSRS